MAMSFMNTNSTYSLRPQALRGTNVTAKIYHISLREITETTNKILVAKTGQLDSDTFWEGYDKAGFNKLNVVESNYLYEY